MTEHLLSKDEIDALLHASARDAGSPDSDADGASADPEALGQLWRLFFTSTLDRWSADWARELVAGPVRVQWGTAEELVNGQPAGALVDVLLTGKLEGAATGKFWAATSAADATAFTTLAGNRGPWGDLGVQVDDRSSESGVSGAPSGDEDGESANTADQFGKADVPTTAADAFLKAITSEMETMSGQLFPQPIAFTYEEGATLISGLGEALSSGRDGEGDDQVLVELSCRLSGDGIEVPVSFLLDGESTDALLSCLAKQTAGMGGSPAGSGLSSRDGRPVASLASVQAGVGGPESSFRHGISGVDRPKTEPAKGVTISPAQFLPLGEAQRADGEHNLDLILDVPLEVRVELGRTHMQIRDVLELGKGSVVELDKLAGEPVDVLVNGKLLAKGEVVVIDENFGVKVTDIVSPMERIRDLQ